MKKEEKLKSVVTLNDNSNTLSSNIVLGLSGISLNTLMGGNNGHIGLNEVYYTPTNGPAGKHSDETQWTSKAGAANNGWVQDGLYDCINGRWINEPN